MGGQQHCSLKPPMSLGFPAGDITKSFGFGLISCLLMKLGQDLVPLLLKEKKIKLLFKMDSFSTGSFRVPSRAAVGFLTCLGGLALAG